MDKYTLIAKQAASLNSVIKRELPLLPELSIRQALKKRDVRVNGTRVSTNVSLNAGDEVILFTEQPMKEVPLLYIDEDVLLINKPAGLNSDDNEASSYTVLDWVRQHHPAVEQPSLVHRLDNQTSGFLLVARNEQAAEILKDLFRTRMLKKQYIGLVAGTPQPRQAIHSAWLIKDAQKARVQVSQKELPGSKQIITEYDTISPGAFSRLLISLHTGRTHQIRAHLAFLGHPILGDEVYGDRQANRDAKARDLKLCATRIEFPKVCALQQLQGKVFEITPPF